jgi:hypothetical protein
VIKYAREWEAKITECLAQGLVTEKILDDHYRKIEWIQHERLVHLLVMLFTCAVCLCSFVLVLIVPSILSGLLCILLLALSLAYIKHYYDLENRVQGWYVLADKLKQSLH